VARGGNYSVIFFHDCGWSVDRGERGERKIFAEFLHAHGPFETRALLTYFEKARVFLLCRV